MPLYLPTYLVEKARLSVNTGRYEDALRVAKLAERHWGRLPSEQVFMKKAEIYEVIAAANQALFYRSEDDLVLLDEAIKSWGRYHTHVESKRRGDMMDRADAELAKLEDIRERLE